jgi:hypothetical protein
MGDGRKDQRDKIGRGNMRVVTKMLGAGLLATAVLATAGAAGSLALPAVAATSSTAASSTVTPGTGFAYGTDSWPMTVTGSGPYKEPVLGTGYGGYMGMAGNWARTLGCNTGNFLAWAPANANQANANFKTYHVGVGTGVYWYMGGPGVDPHWNGTTTEAFQWGKVQASWALAAIKGRYIPYPVIWADIELPGIAPAPDSGWNSVYTSPCSGKTKQSFVPAVIDRTVFNGFASYLTSHSKYKVGVYSSPLIWPSIFGNGKYASLPNTYEWTYSPETASLSAAPNGWCLRGTPSCAQFFGGQSSSSKYALMWQWSGGGGVRNGFGDFDQINVTRMR